MDVIISVKDLKKNYGKFEAVKGISFDVYEGDILLHGLQMHYELLQMLSLHIADERGA